MQEQTDRVMFGVQQLAPVLFCALF